MESSPDRGRPAVVVKEAEKRHPAVMNARESWPDALPTEVHPRTDHHASRIQQDVGLLKIRGERIVGLQSLLRRVIERVEHLIDGIEEGREEEVERHTSPIFPTGASR